MSDGRRVIWDDAMLARLRSMRAERIPLLLCAEKIGVGYSTCVYKARELDLAGRMNRGRVQRQETIAAPANRP
jgi:hypothetical protein